MFVGVYFVLVARTATAMRISMYRILCRATNNNAMASLNCLRAIQARAFLLFCPTAAAARSVRLVLVAARRANFGVLIFVFTFIFHRRGE